MTQGVLLMKNLKSKKVIINASAAVVALILAVVLVTCASGRKSTIAFYGLGDAQIKGIESVIDSIAEQKHLHFEYIVYDSEKKLESQIPLSGKPRLLFTTSGYAVNTAVKDVPKKAGVSPELTSGMTSSLRGAVKYNSDQTKITALPILSSHNEVDIETAAFRNSGMAAINTWKDVEDFIRIQKRKVEYPVMFAGSEPSLFLDMLGSLTEAIEGAEAYGQAVEILKSGEKKFDAVKLADELSANPDSPLITTVKMLSNWYKLGYIHPGTFSFKMNDLEAFAQSKLVNVMFMPLENHRTFNQDAISRFTSIYYPSSRTANSRVFTGKTIFALPLSKAKDAETLVSALISKENEEKLSRATGLAPVLAQCRTPDKQADDARYWIAATAAPLAGLSNEVYLTKEQKTKLAAELAARIRYGN